ncbi:hypothetical protein FBR02_02870 [Anaerolineae bacterium CFX9]|nr:hypothetical protein [Anaerolineae bacterium CFX9]
MTGQDTIISRPLPRRPETGLLAWLATIGYISAEYSPDATLMLRVTPGSAADALVWNASASWAQVSEQVSDLPSLSRALSDLWKAVEAKHRIFKTLEAAARKPALYAESEWVDRETDDTLRWLCDLAGAAFGTEWALILIYRPVETQDLRAQARLVARKNAVQIGGSGASLRDACIALYRHAAPNYFSS